MEDDQSKIVHENILNFKSKDENFVLNSIRQIGKIVEVLGLERTVSELLPYLQELLNEHAAIVSALLEGLLSLSLDFSSAKLTRQEGGIQRRRLFL
jgi:hypothetical protein